MRPPSVFTSPAVDWSLAYAVAGRFAPDGPQISSRDAYYAVAEIKEHAQEAQEHVRDVTGLIAREDHRVVVVDRRMWVDSNLRALDSLLDMWPASKERLEESSTVTRAVGPRVMAVQLGAALGWLSGKILGQYEALADPGRLLLVAPSIVQVERSLDLDSRDFRLWVCLHEETHRVQFGAVPWLKGHFTGLVMKALDAFDETTPMDRLGAVLTELLEAVGERRTPDLMFALQSAEQRAVVEEITAFMSLLEGHADVVMDEVGPRVIPSVDVIRERFEARRSSAADARGADSVWRRVLGMDAKLRQYREGAAFVRAVVNDGGMAAMNRVWADPGNVPTLGEIREPSLWLDRMRGAAA